VNDIDWAHDEIVIFAPKTGRRRVLPLTRPAGEAVLDYLLAGPPVAASGAIDENLAKAWLADCATRAPNTRRARYYLLRRFCRFLAARCPGTFVPGESLRPRRRPPKLPHIYTQDEVRALLAGALALRDWTSRHPCPIRSATLHPVILLLATPGLRISEALHLTLRSSRSPRQDSRSQEAVRVIMRKTNRRHMTGDHHGRTATRATLLVTAVDEILGTHTPRGASW
jgi:integrase